MKRFVALLLLLVQYNSYLRTEGHSFSMRSRLYFPDCKNITLLTHLQKCFDTNVFKKIYENFKVPQKALDESYKGEVVSAF